MVCTYLRYYALAYCTFIAKWVVYQGLFYCCCDLPAASTLREMGLDSTRTDIISMATGMPDSALYPITTFSQLFSEYVQDIIPADLGYIPTKGYGRRTITKGFMSIFKL